MLDRGRRPRLAAPPGACDTHSHVYAPRAACPHVPGRTPDLVAELPADEAMLDRPGIERAVIVQPSLCGFDNRVTLDAISALGPARARGVVVCRPEVTAAELRALDERGARGLRFFLLVDDVGLDVIEPMARLCADPGWHVVVLATRPDRLLWGANWPHPNSPVGARPDEADCLDPLLGWVPDEGQRRAILVDNAARLYGF
jgi:predicted TIM-barrel fold metal-dependent hydrolase